MPNICTDRNKGSTLASAHLTKLASIEKKAEGFTLITRTGAR